MYLHSRACEEDFLKIMRENRNKFENGCVHSYTGTKSEMLELVEMGLYIGLNGCSLKNKENVEFVKDIPIDRIMLETDAPYCEIKNNSVVKQYVKTNFPVKDKKNLLKDT